MDPKDDLEKKDDAKTDPGTSGDQVTDQTKSQKSDAGDDDGASKTVSRASYEGLQKVVAKKDAQIADLQKQVGDFATQLEEAKLSVQEKSKLQEQLNGLQQQVTGLTADRDRIALQSQQMQLVLTDFAQLGSLAQYVPPAPDLETYRKNAEKLFTDLNSYVEARVKDRLAGAGPATPRGTNDHIQTSDEEDTIWKVIYATAGKPGKEKEYEDAKSRLDALQKAKTTQS